MRAIISMPPSDKMRATARALWAYDKATPPAFLRPDGKLECRGRIYAVPKHWNFKG